MTIGPTVGGGLKLVPESDDDWHVLLEIVNDAEGNLPEELAGLMDDDSMWNDIVVPELEEEFSRQRFEILESVMDAKESAEQELIIEAASAEAWYGSLNQARLALESRFRFGRQKTSDPQEIKNREMKAAYFRNEFYVTVQSLLLEYVIK